MFKAPFSFEGRIRRLEYGLTIIIATAANFIAQVISLILAGQKYYFIPYLFFLPFYVWFVWAQGAKRCHDVGNSGWYQLIPFYPIYLIFGEGDYGSNQYGKDPKNINAPSEYDMTTPQERIWKP
jgi:hypothetical protein